jgi:plasmid stabilization system protein ParE
MTFRVIVLPQAKADIARNARWWAANHSVDQALDWLEAVEIQMQKLSENPERFGVSPENDIFSFEIRHMLVGLGNRKSYRAVYTVKEDAVFVLTVRRGEEDSLRARDFPGPVRSNN